MDRDEANKIVQKTFPGMEVIPGKRSYAYEPENTHHKQSIQQSPDIEALKRKFIESESDVVVDKDGPVIDGEKRTTISSRSAGRFGMQG